MQEKKTVADVYVWTVGYIFVATLVSKSMHFTTFINIVYFPFLVN